MTDTLARAREIVCSYEGPALRIMEVCGTHTHELFRLGIRSLLPPAIRLISGPGCPVCVTPQGFIDDAARLALDKGAAVCTFGDLLRVPGSAGSLSQARGQGADVRVVYSALDCLAMAAREPAKEFVFLSVGFETTVPSECLAVKKAALQGIGNFSLLCANKTMPEAYKALRGCADAFLYPGHVCAVTGTGTCRAMAEAGVSGVVAGFSAQELMTALAVIVSLSRDGMPFFRNCYPRVVREEGNPAAMALVAEIMEPCDSEWRGLGVIPGSGLRLKPSYRNFDALHKFAIAPSRTSRTTACRCGEVLRGGIQPPECPLFGRACTPEHPVGACMVSHEGACSAWHLYGMQR